MELSQTQMTQKFENHDKKDIIIPNLDNLFEKNVKKGIKHYN